MIIDKINNWLTHAKQYFFTYKDGFFFLSYLSNSPQLIIESCKRLPFIKIDNENQMFFTDNSFVKSSIHYMELERGLWVMNSKVKYKNNVAFKAIYDAATPTDYYCLTLNILENELSTEYYEMNNIKVENKSISFLKLKGDYFNYHFKGSSENQYIIYFNDEWAKNNILSIPELSSEIKNIFEKEEVKFINYKFNEKNFESCMVNFRNFFVENKKPNLLDLKKNTYDFLDVFVHSINELQVLNQSDMSLKDRLKFKKIEQFLIDNLYNKFPGIDLISKEFSISATKLKSDFKKLQGVSMFQFFQAKQMDVALELLKQDAVLIKDIAEKFQYENSSKFSQAFKKHHGVLPSQIHMK